MKNITITSLIFFFAFLNPFFSNSQERDMVKEHQFEMQLNAIDPSSLETFKNATAALDHKNYILADSLYSIVYTHVPTFEPPIH
jgi:hypothetical protein